MPRQQRVGRVVRPSRRSTGSRRPADDFPPPRNVQRGMRRSYLRGVTRKREQSDGFRAAFQRPRRRAPQPGPARALKNLLSASWDCHMKRERRPQDVLLEGHVTSVTSRVSTRTPLPEGCGGPGPLYRWSLYRWRAGPLYRWSLYRWRAGPLYRWSLYRYRAGPLYRWGWLVSARRDQRLVVVLLDLSSS